MQNLDSKSKGVTFFNSGLSKCLTNKLDSFSCSVQRSITCSAIILDSSLKLHSILKEKYTKTKNYKFKPNVVRSLQDA